VELTGLEVEVADGVDELEQDEKMDAAVPTIPTRITARLAGRRRATCEA
jgi:hypothetical protein